MKRLVFATLILAASCGGSPDIPTEIVPQWHYVGGQIECIGTSTTHEFQSGSLQTFDCIWYCATYRGKKRQYVDIGFENDGAGWVLASQFVADGICN